VDTGVDDRRKAGHDGRKICGQKNKPDRSESSPGMTALGSYSLDWRFISLIGIRSLEKAISRARH